MLKNAQYIYDNIIIADEELTTKKYCKKAQVGVDLSIQGVFKIASSGAIHAGYSKVSNYEEIDAEWSHREDAYGWYLPQGTYLISLNEGVRIPEDIACYIIQRSSFNRSGCTTVSSLWDNGYTSEDEDGIHPMTIRLNVDTDQGVWIERNARVAQIIAMTTEEAELYNGQFQGGSAKSNLL